MDQERLVRLNELSLKLNVTKVELQKIRNHLHPMKGIPSLIDEASKAHSLRVGLKAGDGAAHSVEVFLPAGHADRFFNEMERFFDGEVRALQAEFDRA